jgi:hypothetical protein
VRERVEPQLLSACGGSSAFGAKYERIKKNQILPILPRFFDASEYGKIKAGNMPEKFGYIWLKIQKSFGIEIIAEKNVKIGYNDRTQENADGTACFSRHAGRPGVEFFEKRERKKKEGFAV